LSCVGKQSLEGRRIGAATLATWRRGRVKVVRFAWRFAWRLAWRLAGWLAGWSAGRSAGRSAREKPAVESAAFLYPVLPPGPLPPSSLYSSFSRKSGRTDLAAHKNAARARVRDVLWPAGARVFRGRHYFSLLNSVIPGTMERLKGKI
jgi:hypothetical protein